MEFQHRLRAAWGKFHELWPLLGKRDASLHKRLRLFDSTVTKAALWCSESWTLTVKEKKQLRTAQRDMLRRFAGPKRKPDETYVDWIQRATHAAECRARNAGSKRWLDLHLNSKWKWAAKLADASHERLARRVTFWRDSAWWSHQERGAAAYGVRPIRAKPGSMLRWEDDMRRFCEKLDSIPWQDLVMDRERWFQESCSFRDFAGR